MRRIRGRESTSHPRRLAPLSANDRKRIELLNALLLSLPGTQCCIRRRNRAGRQCVSRRPQRRPHPDAMELGQKRRFSARIRKVCSCRSSSIRNIIRGGQRGKPAAQSALAALVDQADAGLAQTLAGVALAHRISPTDNRKILAFVRKRGNECALVVCNLSRFGAGVELNLSAFEQLVPVEMFSRNAFPPILDKTLSADAGPHAYYWFSLEQRSSRGRHLHRAGSNTGKFHCSKPSSIGGTVGGLGTPPVGKASSKVTSRRAAGLAGGPHHQDARINEVLTVPDHGHKSYFCS